MEPAVKYRPLGLDGRLVGTFSTEDGREFYELVLDGFDASNSSCSKSDDQDNGE